MQRKLDEDYDCPIEVTLDVIGGKWKGMILYALMNAPDSKARFNELRRLMPKVTQRMLTMQLRELERDGVIFRTVYPEVPPRVEYALTEFGRSLESVLKMMSEWGTRYRARVTRIKRDAMSHQPGNGVKEE
ncbi:MAG TPA: helix-turn-helix domain-containing protein [Xanthobacteraceae bacterium]|nr:helix-turn-helix domain-containing protein [Xanthobacteraceae bacterium]